MRRLAPLRPLAPLLALLCALLPAGAGAEWAPARDSVELWTVAPGTSPFAWFGHSLLVLRHPEDPAQDRALSYGHNTEPLGTQLWGLLRDDYAHHAEWVPPGRWRERAAAEDRAIHAQRLRLDEVQRQRLWRAAAATPDEAPTRYHLAWANCATELRDLIDQTVGGRLEQSTAVHHRGGTWRDLARRRLAFLPPLVVAWDLGLGARGDQPISDWERGFLPVELAAVLEGQGLSAPRSLLQAGALRDPVADPRSGVRAWATRVVPLGQGLIGLVALLWGAWAARRPRWGLTLWCAATGLVGWGLIALRWSALGAFVRGNPALWLVHPLGWGVAGLAWWWGRGEEPAVRRARWTRWWFAWLGCALLLAAVQGVGWGWWWVAAAFGVGWVASGVGSG